MPADEPRLTSTTVVVRSDAQASCQIDDETVIMHLETGRYFGYDPVGTRIWALMKEPRTVSAICEQLVTEYEGVEASQCTSDVLAFLRELLDEGLVTIRNPEAA